MSTEKQSPKGGTTTIERVIDGDTIVVTTPEGKSEEVQLIGIQAPEDEKMGQEATEFIKGRLRYDAFTNENVRLEFDVQKRDKYGRLLAYVYIKGLNPFFHHPEEEKEKYSNEQIYKKLDNSEIIETFVNALIISEGYATPMTIPPNEEALGEARTVSDGAAHHNVKYADLFKELYEEAREQKRGLWAELIITKGEAVDIAKEKLQTESFVDDIDINRVNVSFREEENDYWIDFAWKGGETDGRGLWWRGYYVVVDAITGNIKESTAYKR